MRLPAGTLIVVTVLTVSGHSEGEVSVSVEWLLYVCTYLENSPPPSMCCVCVLKSGKCVYFMHTSGVYVCVHLYSMWPGHIWLMTNATVCVFVHFTFYVDVILMYAVY